MNHHFNIPVLALSLLVVSTPEVHAYLDPGTGAVIIQGIVGAVAAASVAIGDS